MTIVFWSMSQSKVFLQEGKCVIFKDSATLSHCVSVDLLLCGHHSRYNERNWEIWSNIKIFNMLSFHTTH